MWTGTSGTATTLSTTDVECHERLAKRISCSDSNTLTTHGLGTASAALVSVHHLSMGHEMQAATPGGAMVKMVTMFRVTNASSHITNISSHITNASSHIRRCTLHQWHTLQVATSGGAPAISHTAPEALQPMCVHSMCCSPCRAPGCR